MNNKKCLLYLCSHSVLGSDAKGALKCLIRARPATYQGVGGVTDRGRGTCADVTGIPPGHTEVLSASAV